MPSAPFLGSASEHGRGALRGQRFQRLSRDLYVLGPEPPALAGRVAGLQLVLPDAVACLHSAARLIRLPVDDDGLVHLARAGDASWSERADVRVHRFAVEPDERMAFESGVVVTTATRTFADLAAHLSLEMRMRLRLHDAGFRALRHGVTVLDEAGGWLADPDLGDPVARVAVQHDGEVHFKKGTKQRRHDVDRDDLCREQGWEVVVSTAVDDAQPHRLVRRVAAAYLRAAERSGRQVLPPHLL